jgi:hypothetical protein
MEATMAATNDTHRLADEELKLETEVAEAIGVTSPTAWWRWGLVALAVVIAVLLVLRFAGGNSGTAVVPGTPIAAPQTEHTN